MDANNLLLHEKEDTVNKLVGQVEDTDDIRIENKIILYQNNLKDIFIIKISDLKKDNIYLIIFFYFGEGGYRSDCDGIK